MPSVLNMLPNAVSQQADQVFSGTVSSKKPSPSHPADPLYIQVDWNSTTLIEITNWPLLHGSTMPQPGDDVLLIEDDQRYLRCIWWSGPDPTSTAARVYRLAPATTSTGWNKIQFDTVDFDEGMNWDVLTNHRYTVPQFGTYHISGQVETAVAGSTISMYVSIYQNGDEARRGGRRDDVSSTGTDVALTVSDLVQCYKGDYIELWVYTSQVVALAVNVDALYGGYTAQSGSVTNYLSIAQVS